MAPTANTVIASERFSMFEQMLRASGWAGNRVGGEDCWLAPEHLRAISAAEYGAGHLHIWDALSLQARADLSTMATMAA